MRIGGMSSRTASSMVALLALAVLSTTIDSGSPPRSPATCSLDPALPRSTGLAPVGCPLDSPQAEGVDAHPPQVDAPGLAEVVQQQRLQLPVAARGRLDAGLRLIDAITPAPPTSPR
jgi:hypothetical protein